MSLTESRSLSAYDFDVIKEALKASILEERLPEQKWRARAEELVRTFIGKEAPDEEIMRSLLNSCRIILRNSK